MNLIPRSYAKDIPPGKDTAFRLTSKYGKEFGSDFSHLLSRQGKTIIQRNIEEFEVTNFINHRS